MGDYATNGKTHCFVLGGLGGTRIGDIVILEERRPCELFIFDPAYRLFVFQISFVASTSCGRLSPLPNKERVGGIGTSSWKRGEGEDWEEGL